MLSPFIVKKLSTIKLPLFGPEMYVYDGPPIGQLRYTSLELKIIGVRGFHATLVLVNEIGIASKSFTVFWPDAAVTDTARTNSKKKKETFFIAVIQ